MQEELDDPRSIPVEMFFQIDDRMEAMFPEVVRIEQFLREPFRFEDVAMNANDQHLFVIRTIENADVAAFRQISRRFPEKVMIQIFRTGLFKAVSLADLRIAA